MLSSATELEILVILRLSCEFLIRRSLLGIQVYRRQLIGFQNQAQR